MIADIYSMMWKESRTLFRKGPYRSRLLRMVLIPAVLSSVFPISWGADWVNEFPALIIAFITPAVLVGMMIPDSFAGERERHTMGTLLATQLPDQAILIGKMAIPVMVGWGAALFFTFLSLVVVNIAHGQGELLFYAADITVGIFVFSFLVATTMAGGGVVTSLRAESAQAAAQKLMTLILVPAMVVQIVPLLFIDQIRTLIVNVDGIQFMIALMILFAFVDMILFITAVIRFQRSKMYLDL